MADSLHSQNRRTVGRLVANGMFGEAVEYINLIQNPYRQMDIIGSELYYYALTQGRVNIHPVETVREYLDLKERYSLQEVITDRVVLVDPETLIVLAGEKEFVESAVDPRNLLLKKRAEIEKIIQGRVRVPYRIEC